MGNKDLHIDRAGTYSGGEFDNVSISGSGKINGDVSCKNFSSSGTSKVEGKIICEKFKSAGSGKVYGNLEGEEIVACGYFKVKGDVKGENICLFGMTKITGSVKGERIGGAGVLSVNKNIEAEEVHIEGSVYNKGIINAEKVMIECKNGNENSSFHEIGASVVTIKGCSEVVESNVSRFLLGMFTGISTRGTVGHLIEGDTIYVEHAKIEIIRGEKVTIGPHMEVGCVEYTQELQVSDTAVVKEIIKR